MRIFIYSILINFCFWTANAQEKTLKPLQIGDTVPDLVLKQVINHTDTTLRISDFRGKLLVLDFWNTTCIACIGAFPKLEKLQRDYEDQLMVLPVVTHQGGNRQRYLDFFQMRQKRGKPVNLPSVVEDSVLVQLFPFQSLPHIVWISKKGIVLGITSGTDLNEGNVMDVLNDETTELPVKYSLRTQAYTYDKSKPLLIDDNGGAAIDFSQRSILLRYTPNMPGSGNLRISRDSTHTHITMINSLLPMFLRQVFAGLHPKGFSRITSAFVGNEIICETTREPVFSAIKRWNSSDGKKYVKKEDDYYSYEMSLLGNKSDREMLEAMLADLNRIFEMRAFMEIRPIPCMELYLKDIAPSKTKFPKERPLGMVTEENNFYRVSLTNSKITSLVNLLNSKFDYPFMVDATGFEDRVDLDVELFSKGELKELEERLEQLGFGLRPAVKEFEVLVVADARH